MKTNKFYKSVILVLILLNLTLLYFILRPPVHHGPPGKYELVDELGLEGQKRNTVLEMQEKHFYDKRQLMDKKAELHEKLYNSFNNPEIDSTDISSLMEEITANQHEIVEMTYAYFQDVNALCDSDQQIKLKNILHEALRRSSGTPPPPKK